MDDLSHKTACFEIEKSEQTQQELGLNELNKELQAEIEKIKKSRDEETNDLLLLNDRLIQQN